MTIDPAEAERRLGGEVDRARELVSAATSLDELERAEVALLGRKAPLSEIKRALGDLDTDARKTVGRATNEARASIEALLGEARDRLAQSEARRRLEAERIDVSLPGRRNRPGSIHPLAVVEYRIIDVFMRMGYRVVEGPEIETDWYNFEALNIPPDHPARTVKDTLYVDVADRPDLLLRTETSAMQIHTMEAQEPPVYIVSPGRTFRRDTQDATHSPVFHQIEGLAVDEGLSFADLKGTLEAFAKAMFGPDQRIRLNASYFPFVEPGAQVEVSCFVCGGVGCRTCGNGWIEILGTGMVHPKVLENCGYDSERYTGFAFGMGIERVAMLAHGLPDIRLLFESDVRFLSQFQAVG
jgi:phenylalanyl-tRNA synthetase alpha chain